MAYTEEEIKAVTFVKGAIHSPQDVRHFMDIGRPTYTVVASLGDNELARSAKALKVKEVGRGVYDPVIYFPREDVAMEKLTATDKTTHCPLKGDTTYFDFGPAGQEIKDIAWSYTQPIPESEIIRDYVAFDVSLVQVTEHTVNKN